jgi:hypothetical protein
MHLDAGIDINRFRRPLALVPAPPDLANQPLALVHRREATGRAGY